jgi:hypothetical protein
MPRRVRLCFRVLRETFRIFPALILQQTGCQETGAGAINFFCRPHKAF